MKSKIGFAMADCGMLTCFLGASGLNSESDEGFFISLAIAAVGLAVVWMGLLLEKIKRACHTSHAHALSPMT